MCGDFQTAQSFYIFITDICQPRWSYFGGYCYFTSRVCASWLTAESNCSTMSSNLVTVHNQEENVYIQHRHNGERSWIGLNDRSVEGSFVWTNKEISKFRFWAPQQPNDWKNEDCVHTLGAKHGYTWNDVPCTNCYNYTCFKGTKRSKIYNYLILIIFMFQIVNFSKHVTTLKKVITQFKHIILRGKQVRQIAWKAREGSTNHTRLK